MIYDLILIIIFIVLIAINVHRGAAKALAGILTAIVSYAAATALGRLLAGFIYDAIIRPSLESAVSNAVTDISTQTAGNIANTLPGWLTGLLHLSGENITDALADPIAGAGETISQAVNAAVQPIAVNLLTFFITILLFLLFLFILRKLIVKPLLRVFDFPVIRTVNRFLGGVIGFADAFLLVSMCAYLIRLLLNNSDGYISDWLNESTIYNSFIFYHFYSGNIFTAISSLLA